MKIILSLFLMLSILGNIAAQKQETKRNDPILPGSEAAKKTRARTIWQTEPTQGAESSTGEAAGPKVETASDKSSESPANQQPTQTTAPAKPSEAEGQQPPEDPIPHLREQIDGASSPAEHNSLVLKLVDALLAADKKADALAELRTMANTDVFDPQGFYNAGNAFARLGENEDAIQAYRKAVEQRKGNYSRALNNLGVVLLRSGRWDEAYQALMSALKIERFGYAEASYNLGRLYADRGENDLAVREWRRTLTLNPRHAAASEAIARIGSEGRVTVEASRVASAKRTTSSKKPASRAPKEEPEAIKTTLDKARTPLVLDPASFDLLQRARSDNEKGKTRDAIASYKRLLVRQTGYFAPANLELSFALITSQRYDEALDNLQMVVTRDGDRYPISYYHLARLYEAKGDLKQAEQWFSRAAEAFGKRNVQFLLDVSRVREKQGDFKGALESMETYLSIMREQGQQPAWSNERLATLRAKVEKK